MADSLLNCFHNAKCNLDEHCKSGCGSGRLLIACRCAVSEADLKPSDNSVISQVLLQISIQPTLALKALLTHNRPGLPTHGNMGYVIFGLLCGCNGSLDVLCNMIS